MRPIILLIIAAAFVGSYVAKFQPGAYVVSVGSQQFVVQVGHEQERQAGQEHPVHVRFGVWLHVHRYRRAYGTIHRICAMDI